MPMTSPEHPVFSVSDLNRLSRDLLESAFSQIWVEGEISNFVKPSSGHWYFSLKDKTAQIRCAMFRPFNQSLRFLLQDGMHVIVRAKVSLYETRGDFQLIVNYLEEAGLGALQRAFEQLKEKLMKEGLFEDKHKKPIPTFPRHIGIITSPTGAAIRDILNVLKRRYPLASIILYPSLVQGDQAATDLAHAIALANYHDHCDILILARGGGSLEDLWPFNEECVVRSIFASHIPIITGIGHEIDFTLADFVADLRAPTPSAAAELATPDRQKILQQLDHAAARLRSTLRNFILDKKKQAEWLTKQFWRLHPAHRLQNKMLDLDRLSEALATAQNRILLEKNHHLELLAQSLGSVSPLATLQRGYAIVTNDQGKTISTSQSIDPGSAVSIQLAIGKLHGIIDRVE